MSFDRRRFILAGMTLTTSTLAAGAARAAQAQDDDPTLDFAFEVVASLDPPQLLGPTGMGERRIIGVTGGTVEGPMLNGVVLPGGADWQLVRADGVSEIHARYTLQADDGALIYVDAPGIREATPEVIARINAGEIVDPSEYYFRTAPRLESSDARYAWMNRRLWICKGVRLPDGVRIRYFVVT